MGGKIMKRVLLVLIIVMLTVCMMTGCSAKNNFDFPTEDEIRAIIPEASEHPVNEVTIKENDSTTAYYNFTATYNTDGSLKAIDCLMYDLSMENAYTCEYNADYQIIEETLVDIVSETKKEIFRNLFKVGIDTDDGGTDNAEKFPTSEEVRATIPQKIDTGEEVLLFEAYSNDVVIPGAEGAEFIYRAYYNKKGDLKEIEFFSRYETCCHEYDEYEAVYNNEYNLVECYYENANNPIVRMKRRLHHYF